MADLSIIIVSYKGWERLLKCLEALASFTGKNFTMEVIVVDNKSDDGTILEIEHRFARFIFIHNKINGGFANGCNLGGSSASGNFLLFLNPDTVATESEILKLIDAAKKNPSFTILSCMQVNERGKECIVSGPFPQIYNLTGLLRAIFNNRKPLYINEGFNKAEDIIIPDWISGSVVLMRKETFQKLHGFDEDFWMYYEDVDICLRAKIIGGEVGLCRNITIEHNHGGSSRINLRTASLTKAEVIISRHVYISKHKTGAERILIQTFLVVNNLITGGIMAVLGMLLFFVPKVFSRTLIFLRVLKYYIISAFRLSWISKRSVNYRN